MAPKPNKRILKFDDLNAMLDEVQSLLDKGYIREGQWTLGQATSHVADWMRYPVDGFPVAPIPIRMLLWLMKVTIGPGLKRKIFDEGFSSGMQTAPQSVADPTTMTDEQGVEKLKETVARITSYQGVLLPSPLFGPMDMDTLVKVTLLHAEHHFGFLFPKE